MPWADADAEELESEEDKTEASTGINDSDVELNEDHAEPLPGPSAYAKVLFENLDIEQRPNLELLTLGVTGYVSLDQEGKLDNRQFLTLIDFSVESTEPRMWVIDLEAGKVKYHTYVAHGMKTGLVQASSFSNRPHSHQSSLGFYRASETYIGKHGFSMRLDGMEDGFNSNARVRNIVLHGAPYVSEKHIRDNGHLGRSQGCPAVPQELSKPIIEAISGGSCLFIYHPSDTYLDSSKLLNQPLEES